MSNLFLYFICVFIWGSTWYVITFQLGVVPPAVSVFYRFGLASLLSFIFCFLTGKKLRFSKKEHFALALQGLCMFCANYILTYYAEANISSGIVAVAFTLLVYFNMFGMRIFYNQKIQPRVVISALVGALGVFFIFYHEVANASSQPNAGLGLTYAIVATFIASVGNVISVGVRKRALPVVESNAWSMLYGTLMTGGIAVFTGQQFSFVFSTSYILSLLYLALFGSVIAFYAYITLIGSIGADKAAYTGILTPVIALILSSMFENFHWTALTFLGMILSILGNYLILKK